MPAYKIEVECDPEKNNFTVRIGDTYEDQMDWGEALACLASILINGPTCTDGTPRLRTTDQHKAFREYLSRPIKTEELLP